MNSNECFTITDKDKDIMIIETKNRYFIYPVDSNDYYIADNINPIIGTYGLDSSLCIIMRDPNTQLTMLAHINKVEDIEYFFPIYDKFKNTNVYMMGGNSSSIDMCKSLLDYFEKRNNYNIKFAHIIDPNTNSLAIDSRTGDIYINPDASYFITS